MQDLSLNGGAPMSMPGRKLAGLGVFVLVATGCGSGITDGRMVAFQVLPPVTADGVAEHEEFELCKDGSSATFSFSVVAYGGPGKTLPGAPQTGNLTLADGECRVIAVYGANGADVTVTETSAQSGFHLDHVDVSIISNGSTSTSTVAGPSVTEFVSGGSGTLRGALAEYFNVADPAGFEGCTPGYWKQDQHLDSWPAPYTSGTLFSAVFEDAFPNLTLLQVLGLGGGGLNALGRHAVAALLNAGSGGVNFNWTTAQVISAFNSLFPASSYESLKNQLAGFNEQGCPLN